MPFPLSEPLAFFLCHRRTVGLWVGWASSGFYLGSRVAQICKNWKRSSAEGLSLAMFGCAIAANVTYGAGILCRTYSWAELLASAPWILGSLGTVTLDVVIFLQVRVPTPAHKSVLAPPNPIHHMLAAICHKGQRLFEPCWAPPHCKPPVYLPLSALTVRLHLGKSKARVLVFPARAIRSANG